MNNGFMYIHESTKDLIKNLPVNQAISTCPKCNSHEIVGFGDSDSDYEFNMCHNCGYEWASKSYYEEDIDQEESHVSK